LFHSDVKEDMTWLAAVTKIVSLTVGYHHKLRLMHCTFELYGYGTAGYDVSFVFLIRN